MKDLIGPERGTALTAAVRSVDGVVELFPSGSVARRLQSALIPTAERAQEIEISVDGEGETLAARIATSSSAPTVETARRVADALLAASANSSVIVTVEVARIH